MSRAVGIVVVSHSERLAAGVCEVAAQMAPDVTIRPAGGTNEGGVGTSFDKILAAAEQADGGQGVVLLYDLGSAKMSAELAAEMHDGARVVDAPLVEGAIAAAVAAQGGAGIDAVAGEASAAGGHARSVLEHHEAPPGIERSFTLRNALGLHARPAAQLARIAAEHGVTLAIAPADGAFADTRSILGVVALGLRGGAAVRVRAAGERAEEALSAIAAAVANGFGELARAPAQSPKNGVQAAVSGIAVGPIRHLRTAEPSVPETTGEPGAERAALDRALAAVDRDLAAERSSIAAAHRLLLTDPELVDVARKAVAGGIAAAPAWWRAVQSARVHLAASPDDLVAQRAMDVADVGMRVLERLAEGAAPMDLSPMKSAIVVADDLVPSLVGQLADAGAAGIVLSSSGVTSHAVVVARGRALPMLVRAGELPDAAEGTLAILDGDRGALLVAPDQAALDEARARQVAAAGARAAALESAHVPVVWKDGRRIEIAANVASPSEAQLARKQGADGIGLLRTELFYVDKSSLPGEDEQAAEIARILEVFPDREVTIRTLDVGGDKAIPALALDPITHGFLGLRGLRHSLVHREILLVQLRAIMRAAAGWRGTLSLMAPMVSTADEIIAFRTAIEEAARSLETTPHRRPDHVGIMVEVPSAAMAFETLSPHVDFASVGTNDLVQYIMAAERTNAAVAHLYQPEHPAIWRALGWLAQSAGGKKIAVCGEMAAHADHAQRLVELGIAELSMAPASIPAIKAALRAKAQAY